MKLDERIIRILERLDVKKGELAGRLGKDAKWTSRLLEKARESGEVDRIKLLAILCVLGITEEDFNIPGEILSDNNIPFPAPTMYFRESEGEMFYQKFLDCLLDAFRTSKNQLFVMEPMSRYIGINSLKISEGYHSQNKRYFEEFETIFKEKIRENGKYVYYRLVQYPPVLDRFFDSPSGVRSGTFLKEEKIFQVIMLYLFEENYSHFAQFLKKYPDNFKLYFVPKSRNWTIYITDNSLLLSLYAKEVKSPMPAAIPDILFVDSIKNRPATKNLIEEHLSILEPIANDPKIGKLINYRRFIGMTISLLSNRIKDWQKLRELPTNDFGSINPIGIRALENDILKLAPKLEELYELESAGESKGKSNQNFLSFLLKYSQLEDFPQPIENLIIEGKSRIYPNQIKSTIEDKVIMHEAYRDRNLRAENFSGRTIFNTVFENCDLRDSSFVGTILDRVSFEGSQINNVDFSRAEIKNCDFSDAIGWESANYSNTKLDNMPIVPIGFWELYERFFTNTTGPSQNPAH